MRLYLLLFFICCEGLAAVAQNPNAKISIVFEKVYLHTDREHYAAGEDIWFKAYLLNGQTYRLYNSSNNLYVELIDSESRIAQRKVIRLDKGIGNGDFRLTDSILPGTYRIRAYTNWMRNFGDNFLFEKVIQVYDHIKAGENIGARLDNGRSKDAKKGSPDRKVTALPSSERVLFFPEGGSLVESVPCFLALKAEDATGNGTSAKGVVMSTSGDSLGEFQTNELGTGITHITPVPGKTYYSKITFNDGKTMDVALPSPLAKGFSLNVRSTDSLLRLSISTNEATLAEFKDREILLMLKSRGKAYWSKALKIGGLLTVLNISKQGMPTGISSITLYDLTGKPHCERLLYHDGAEDAKLHISTDKLNYSPKGNTTVILKSTDQYGAPVKAWLSAAVIDAGAVPVAEADIITYLNLQSEIKGKIVKPGVYFDESNPKRKQQLDLLLLTQGWRDFVWKRVADSTIRISYAMEQGITLSGRVREELSGKPVLGANITLSASKLKGNRLLSSRTDSTGRYYFDGLELYGSQLLKLTSRNAKGEKLGWISMDSLFSDGPPVNPLSNPLLQNEEMFSIREVLINRVKKSKSLDDTIQLRDVVIKAKKPVKLWDQTATEFGYKDEVYNIEPKDYDHADLRHYLLHYSHAMQRDVELSMGDDTRQYNLLFYPGPGGANIYPRMVINNKEAQFTDAKEDLFMMADFQQTYLSLPVNKIKKVVIKRLLSASRMSIGGEATTNPNGVETAAMSTMSPISDIYILYITTVPGALEPAEKDIISTEVSGYYQARTFYIPKYTPISKATDLRTTIHWEPSIIIDARGEAKMTFYNADPKGNVRVVVEGMSEKGIPVAATTIYTVK